MQVALQAHLLVCSWNLERHPTAVALSEQFGTSKQTLSRVSRGERWPGETVMAALVYAARIRSGNEAQRVRRNTTPARSPR